MFFLEIQSDQTRLRKLLGSDLTYVEIDLNASTLPNGLPWYGFWEYLIEKMQACFSGHKGSGAGKLFGGELNELRGDLPHKHFHDERQEDRIKKRLKDFEPRPQQ